LVGEYERRRILGVIIPTIEEVVESELSPVVLFATKRTVESGKYGRELRKLGATTELVSQALPGLVPLIESGRDREAKTLIVAETKNAKAAGAKAVILGCTHYSLLKDVVRGVIAGEGDVFSQDEIIPGKLKDYLERHPEIENKLSRTASRNIYLTAHRSEYDEVIRHLMGGVVIPD
jgi:glutamate racemase